MCTSASRASLCVTVLRIGVSRAFISLAWDALGCEDAVGACRTVDFGAGWWPLDEAFGKAKARNLPGKSPAFVSEF